MEDIRWTHLPEIAYCSRDRILLILYRNLVRPDGKCPYGSDSFQTMDVGAFGQLLVRRVEARTGVARFRDCKGCIRYLYFGA